MLMHRAASRVVEVVTRLWIDEEEEGEEEEEEAQQHQSSPPINDTPRKRPRT
jgi:hypothetical protein